jgi:hypothetical protein
MVEGDVLLEDHHHVLDRGRRAVGVVVDPAECRWWLLFVWAAAVPTMALAATITTRASWSIALGLRRIASPGSRVDS